MDTQTYIDLKEKGIITLKKEDVQYVVDLPQHDVYTGDKLPDVKVVFDKENLESQKTQLEAQIAMRDSELAKINEARSTSVTQLQNVEEILKDITTLN